MGIVEILWKSVWPRLQQFHIVGWKLVILGVFTPHKSAAATNQSLICCFSDGLDWGSDGENVDKVD